MTESNDNLNFNDELLSAFVDGELTAEQCRLVEARLASDPSARKLVAEMKALSSTMRSLPREKLGDNLRATVLNQIPEKRVTLPPIHIRLGRRVVWPVLAIAVALMLMFVQESENRDVSDVAKVEADRKAVPSQPEFQRGRVPVDAPAEVSVPGVNTPAPSASASDSTRATPRTAESADKQPIAEKLQPSMSLGDSLTSNESGVEIVHLTLTDFRTGAERFNWLLHSNGVQVVEPESESPATVANGNRVSNQIESAKESAPSAQTFTTPSAGDGAGAYGELATSTAPSTRLTRSRTESEMVFVEAPVDQIAQILLGCSNDIEAIQEVSIDPTANGTNLAPEQQQLSRYRQFERGANNEAKLKGHNVTPSQQGVIAALNSMEPLSEQSGRASSVPQNQGWATRVREQPADLQQLSVELNNRRNQVYSNGRQQQVADAPQKLAIKQSARPQSIRVLFLLHPSDDASAKK